MQQTNSYMPRPLPPTSLCNTYVPPSNNYSQSQSQALASFQERRVIVVLSVGVACRSSRDIAWNFCRLGMHNFI